MNHFRNMDGAYSFAFSPYWNEGLTREFYNPKTDGVWDVEDMYSTFNSHMLYFWLLITYFCEFKTYVTEVNFSVSSFHGCGLRACELFLITLLILSSKLISNGVNLID